MFTLTSNLDECTRKLDALTVRQTPYAVSRALNDTAKDIVTAERKEMESVFDRPTPFTLNAFFVKPSTKQNLVAVVSEKPMAGKRDFLMREAEGGARRSTALETLLRTKLAITGVLQAILPADNARLDQYGNWSNGQRNEVLAAIGAMRDSLSNRSARSLKRKRNPSTFFVPTSGLPPAVYERTGKGQLHVILAFTSKAPSYEPRFPFERVARETAMKNFPIWFALFMADAMATAR